MRTSTSASSFDNSVVVYHPWCLLCWCVLMVLSFLCNNRQSQWLHQMISYGFISVWIITLLTVISCCLWLKYLILVGRWTSPECPEKHWVVNYSRSATNNNVLHQLLPDRTQTTYNLRSRKHDCSLTVKHSATANEFITRMLYKDMYWLITSTFIRPYLLFSPVRSVNGLFYRNKWMNEWMNEYVSSSCNDLNHVPAVMQSSDVCLPVERTAEQWIAEQKPR